MKAKVKMPSAPGRGQLGKLQTYATPEAWANTITTVSNADFICTAFAQINLDHETVWVTGFREDPALVPHYKWGGQPVLPFPRSINPDHNNYVAVSSFGIGDDGLYHRRKANFGRKYAVMVDDVGTKVSPAKLLLPPNAIVETSPWNFQAWYFLATPESDRIRAERLIKGMIASGLTADGADPGMNGVTRYGRLPVGVNTKAKYTALLRHPFEQRLVHWSPVERFGIDEIASAYGIDLSVAPVGERRVYARKPGQRPPPSSCGNDPMLELLERIDLYLENIPSFDGAHHIVCPWVHEHTDEDPTGTAYFEPSAENAWRGGFKCHHGHCQHRTIADLDNFAARLEQLCKDFRHDK